MRYFFQPRGAMKKLPTYSECHKLRKSGTLSVKHSTLFQFCSTHLKKRKIRRDFILFYFLEQTSKERDIKGEGEIIFLKSEKKY